MMTLDDFRALFRATPYPYLVMAPDLTIVGASGAYLRSVQRTEEDIVGRYVFEAFPEDPDNPDAPTFRKSRHRCCARWPRASPTPRPSCATPSRSRRRRAGSSTNATGA